MDAEEVQQILANPGCANPTPAISSGQTLRERWRKTMFFQKPDRIPNWEFGYWAETLAGWHEQGLPREVKDEKTAYAYFGIEPWGMGCPVEMGLKPAFTREILEDDGEHETYRDTDGSIARINKHGHKSIPHYLDFPVKDRASWEAYRERLLPDPRRVDQAWLARAKAGEFTRREVPLHIWIGSLIGLPRNWIGFEGIAMMVYDDPALLEEMVEHQCQLICATIEPVLQTIEVDFGAGWEDICFNSGPIVGVPFMRDVVAPRYRRITDLLRKYGCEVAWYDCDGDIMPIVDVFKAGGVTGFFPIEVHGGSDPVLIRQRYPEARLQGGICKMKMSKSLANIDAELKRLRPLVEAGGFIPGFDHRVQADVPLVNYLHYLKVKRDLYGVGGTPQYDESKVP